MSDAGNLILFFVILVSLAMAAIPATIAERKGRSFGLWFFYGVVFFVIALIHASLIEPNEDAPNKKKCSDCGGIIPKEAIACSHCGTRFDGASLPGAVAVAVDQAGGDPASPPASAAAVGDWSGVNFNGDRSLTNPRYQTFLVKKYAIEKNDALGKFIVDLDQFDGLAEALAYSHGIESVNARRAQAATPMATAAPAGQGRIIEGGAAARVEQGVDPVVNELDKAAIAKLEHYEYKLVGIESKGGAQVFKLRSTTNGSDFELAGSVKLREFAAQF